MINQSSQFYILVRHFVQRFAKNDMLTFEDERAESLIFKLVFLAAGGGFMAHLLLNKYLKGFPVGGEGIWLERTFFMTVMMAVTGLICVISWDNMFLDSKDYTNLLALPVKIKTLFAAKFAGVLAIISFVSLVFTLFAIPVFSIYVSDPLGINLFFLGFSFLVSTFLANLFVFFFVSAVQGMLLVLFRNNGLKKISILIQGFLAMAFISVIFWFPGLYHSMPELKEKASAFVYLFPPLWFTGLNEKILASKDTVFTSHFYIAIFALALPLVVYLLTLPLSIKLYMMRNVHSQKLPGWIRPLVFLKNLFNRVFLRNPMQRGIFYFFIKTLKRSKKHKLHLTFVMALPIGYVLTQLVYFVLKSGGLHFYNINPSLISFPFILFFSLIAGLRTVVEIPVLPEANWVFKLSQKEDLKHYRIGLKKAIFFSSILPMFGLLTVFYFYFWEFQPAFIHSIFSFFMMLLLLEVFFLSYRKIPFACLYNPQTSNPKATWPLFFFIFIVYAYAFTTLDLLLILKPGSNFYFYIFLFLIFLGLRLQNHKKRDSELIFIEYPTPVFQSLNINGELS